MISLRSLVAAVTLGMALAGTVLLAGCGPIRDLAEAPGAPPPPRASGSAAAGPADAQLAGLTVAEWGSDATYDRDRFADWSAQGDGCDTRDAVLRRDGSDVVVTDDCTITAGTWFSPYDGSTLTDSSKIDIDHVVPLANAWRTGASNWTDQQREDFANDLTRPQLIAVAATVNRAKGDQDPSQWRPPRQDFWCEYAEDWVAVKAYWQLSVTVAERDALAEMLATCD